MYELLFDLVDLVRTGDLGLTVMTLLGASIAHADVRRGGDRRPLYARPTEL